MAKFPFLSHLFKDEPKQEAPAPAPAPEPVPEPAAAPPPEPILRLPPEHALNQLWALRRRQKGVCPAPLLRLYEPGDPLPLTAAEERQELLRLQMQVNASANRRLELAVPKAGKDLQTPPPPPSLDALPVVILSSSQLTAWVLVYPPVGEGAELTRGMLVTALRDADVCWGVDEELLDRLPKDANRYFRLFQAARGRPVVHGRDGYVVDLFRRKIEHKFAVDDYGQLDYSSLNLVQNVAQGDVICRIIPPAEGTPGQTVLGRELPPKAGRKAAPPLGRNTQLSEDGSALLAAVSGHVEFTNRGFQVKPVLEIEGNVDYSVGNISFVGDIHIHGDVLSGFSVRAMGSVIVDGVVEACRIESGGDLTVVKGIVGNDEAVIRSQRSIYTNYLESSCVYAKDILQADCIVNCEVFSGCAVLANGGRGTIIGGRIWAAQEVSAKVVGAPAETPTVICLGGQPCEEFERSRLSRKIAQYEGEIKKLELQPDSAAKLSMLSKARVKLTINRNRLGQVDQTLSAAAAPSAEEAGRSLSCELAYRGTEITIDGVTQRLRHELRPCHAALVQGELVFT